MTRSENWFYVRDPAGPFVKAFTEAFYKPFYRETGIKPVRVTGGVEPTAMIRGMVDRRDYAWDVALVSKSCHLALTTKRRRLPGAARRGPARHAGRIPQPALCRQ